MGVVCAKKESTNGPDVPEVDTSSAIKSSTIKSNNTIQERITEIKQFLSLRSEDTQQIVTPNTQRISITDFQIKQYLAKGGFGKVYTAIHKQTSRIYAMKIINKSALLEESSKMQAISERLILENLSHTFLVKLHFAFHSPSKIFMLVDYVQRGELFYIMRLKGKFTQNQARFFAGEIFLALEYLHRKNIMYRDLKPQNVLLGMDGHVKITDFGISKVFDKNVDIQTFSMCGTPQYIAPEVLKKCGYTFSSDWFSFGALVYDMLTGKPPFYSKNLIEIVEKKLEKSSVSLPKNLSSQAKSFLKGLLNFKPEQRLGSKSSDQIKNHPFFIKLDFQSLIQKKIKPPASIMEALAQISIDCIADNKTSSMKSSLLARTFRSKLSRQLRFAGFEYNKYKGQLTSEFEGHSMNEEEEFDDEG